ncbi:MAG: class I SAM-dependent methyltransferase, partial [Cellulomonas sp.]
GCGTGSLSLLLVEAGHRVCGLDISPGMVAAAREKITGAGHEVELVVGDAAAPPWLPASFDVVLTRHVLWAMADPDAALARWIDLLAPGGRLVLVEGHWWTGAGMTAARASDLVLRHRGEADVIELREPAFWGGAISDERFVVVSRR